MNRRMVSVFGIVFGSMLMMQPLFADNHEMMSDEGFKLTITGSASAQGTTGIKKSKFTGQVLDENGNPRVDAAGNRLQETKDMDDAADSRDRTTDFRNRSTYYQEDSMGEFDAGLSFDASWDGVVGVYLGLSAEEGTDVYRSGRPTEEGYNLRDQFVQISEAYAWMELLPTALVDPKILSIKGQVGIFGARPNISPNVLDDDLFEYARGDTVEYDAENDTEPGSIGQLEIEVLDMVTLQTLLYFGDWNRHDAADLGLGLIFDSGSLISEDHEIKASVSLTADLRETKNDTTGVIQEGDLNDILISDTLSFMVNYSGTFGDLGLNTHFALGLNNLIGWENPDDEAAGSEYAGKALATPDMFVGWLFGGRVSYAEWVGLALGLSGHGEIKRIEKAAGDTDEARILRRSKPVKHVLLRLDSSAVKVLTSDVFDLNLFVQTYMELGAYNNYLLRSVDIGAIYTVISNDEVNVWAQFGYGIAVADPDNEDSFAYSTDFMAVETPGIYFAAGGDFTKTFRTGM